MNRMGRHPHTEVEVGVDGVDGGGVGGDLLIDHVPSIGQGDLQLALVFLVG